MSISDVCWECRHCVQEEITDGLYGYECEEDMESFYNGSQEGCYQFWRKEDEDD